MKKKIVLTTLALTLTLACACGGDGAVKNTEYEEYATQVRTVMYDLGLTTENPQSNNSVTAQWEDEYATLLNASDLATFDHNKTNLLNLAQGYADKVERDTLSAYTNVFEQSFYIPLIMGKALADHYKVSTFYGVCANSPWNQYVQTIKDGNVKTTKVYTPAGEVFEKETFIEMALDYTSAEDYEIRVKQCTFDFSRVYFVYADGETFLEISYEQGNTENCYVSYSLDGFNGYNCKDENTALQAKNWIQDEFMGIDQVAMRQIKTNAKYTVNEEKWEEANSMFFSGGEEMVQSPYGWADENMTVLSSYRCFETTKRIEIPARVRYLTNDFSISYDDGVEPTEELYIPKTVIGIKGYPQNDNPDPNPNPNAGMPQLIDLTAKDFRIMTWNWEPLKKIVVEEGSTLFMAGEGHLRALDGEVVCYLNLPHPTGKVLQEEFMGGGKLPYDLLDKYPLLTQSITELVCSERFLGEISDMTRRFPAVQKVDVTFPDPMGGETRALTLETSRDLTLYLHAKGSYNIEYQGQGTLTVYLDYKDVRLDIRAKACTVYSKWNKTECDLMQAFGFPICAGATTIYYEETADDAYAGISFQWGTNGMEAVLDASQASNFVVPATVLGYAIPYVLLENSVNTPVSVTLSASIDGFGINNTWTENGKSNYGNNVTVQYDGTKEEFLRDFSSSDENPQYIQLVCNGYTGKINSFVQKVTIINEEAQICETYYEVILGGDVTITGKNIVPTYREGRRYYYTDENGNTYNVTNASEDGGSITIPNCSSDNSPDITLTYHEGEGGALLEIYVVTGDIRELVYSKRVKEGTYVNPQYDGAGKLIITIRHNNDGVDEPKPDDVIEVEIDGTYRGDMEYPINQDTVLELMIA